MSKRSYAQYCGVAKALDVVGERWTLLIVRNLLLGPARYGELMRGLPGITTNLLAARLQEMEEQGLIERVRLAAGSRGQAYRLTAGGRALEPAIHALGAWGAARMGAPGPDDHRNFEWLVVSLRRRYRGGAEVVAELVADGVPYHLAARPEGIDVGRGAPARPDLRLDGPAPLLAALFLDPANGARVPPEVRIDDPAGKLGQLVGAFAPMRPA